MSTISPLPDLPSPQQPDAGREGNSGQPSPVKRAANRRRERRRDPVAALRASLLPGCLGLGKKNPVTLVNLSEAGAAVRTQAEFRLGQEVTLVLDASYLHRPIELPATICRLSLEEGLYHLGLMLRKPMSYADLQRLTRM